MAFSTFRFDEYSIAQIEAILEQRDRAGFHAYYDDGYKHKKFSCIAPWYLRNGCILTSVFRYPSKETDDLTENSEINLGRFNRHLSDRISILFEKQNAILLQYIRSESVKDTLKLTDKNVKGFHVIQFIRGSDELMKVTGKDIDEYVVLYCDESTPKFSMVETHFTMSDTAMISKDPAHFNKVKNYYFFHEGLGLGVGGYALWNGKWKPGTKVSARDNNGAYYAGEVVVPPSGIMLAMVKVYPKGIAFLDATDRTKTPVISDKYKHAELRNLFIKPDPETLKEFIAGGFDATKTQFGFTTPGYLSPGCSITTVFTYPVPRGLPLASDASYTTNLGKYSSHLRSVVTLTFEGDNAAYVEYWYENVKQSAYNLSSRDMKGFHVVQYEVNQSGLQVIVDGESVIQPGSITDVAEYTVYYTSSFLDLAPFAFFETHYTMDDVATIINIPAHYNTNKDYYFPHNNVAISVGGYALWNGTWTPGENVVVVGPGLAAEMYVPQTGNLVALVKVYRDGVAFMDAQESSKPPTLHISSSSIGLSSLFILPSPQNLVEFKAVTGEITY